MIHNKENDSTEYVKMPIDLKKIGSNFYIVILLIKRSYFKEPFFLDTLLKHYNIGLKCKDDSEGDQLVRSFDYSDTKHDITLIPIETFLKDFEREKMKKKVLFIFHISRCGSTLITQMLNESPTFFTISEPPIINRILDPKSGISDSITFPLLKAAINAINITAPIESQVTVIKFRSWISLFLKNIIEMFPETPWLFVHRNGAEVLSSVIQSPPGWLRSKNVNKEFFGKLLLLSESDFHNCSENEFITRLLGQFCKIARENQSENTFFINYASLQQDLFAYLDSIKGQKILPEEKELMRLSMQLYSKDVSRKKLFKSDSAIKLSSLSKTQLLLAEKFIEVERNKLTNKNYSNF